MVNREVYYIELLHLCFLRSLDSCGNKMWFGKGYIWERNCLGL